MFEWYWFIGVQVLLVVARKWREFMWAVAYGGAVAVCAPPNTCLPVKFMQAVGAQDLCKEHIDAPFLLQKLARQKFHHSLCMLPSLALQKFVPATAG